MELLINRVFFYILQAFSWSMQTQSVILSSFFWGYVILQIPGGELAAKFGGKILLIISISINSIVSLLIPIGANYVSSLRSDTTS